MREGVPCTDKKVKFEIVIEATLENLSPEDLDLIYICLKEISGDASLKIRKIEQG